MVLVRIRLLLATVLVVVPGCPKRGAAPSAADLRDKAVAKVVGDFRQELVALSAHYPALAGIESFTYTHLGFSYVNNTVIPRVHIAVGVEDASVGPIAAIPVGGKQIPGTSFVVALQLECADTDLRQKIEDAYTHLMDNLKMVK
jgi:hypothetical protein